MCKRQAVAACLLGVAVAVYLLHQSGLHAQQSERPGHSRDNPIDVPRDLSGLSIV